ncbi:MAG: ankyrin repeat domain-containing protein [Victivallaceae bacterium]|nr:ankyrin repeat domain-containing protein [Victivallaceae bacterium]
MFSNKKRIVQYIILAIGLAIIVLAFAILTSHTIYYFSKSGNNAFIKTLIFFGVHNDLKDESGKTPLMIAALYNQKKVVDLLIKNKANIESVDKKGNTALLLSVIRRDNLEVIKKLLNSGSNIDHADNYGKTAFIRALTLGHYKQADLLLKRGANINHLDKHGRTVLMNAAFRGKYEAIKYLITNGANPKIVSRKGLTAYQYAKKGELETKSWNKAILGNSDYQKTFQLLK